MAEINKLSEFIDSYVDASRSMNQQAASLDSMVSLVKKDVVPTETLADWRALRGALVGCLALTRRKSSVGMFTTTDAKALTEFYFRNVHVQALGQYDRKLCFELMECLLECHSDAVASLDHLVIGLCAAIDEEKDPQFLMSVFHIVELLACLFPDPCGVLAGFASELFEVISCYFPIHFTHLIPIMMDALLALSNKILDKDVMYDLLLVLSGILTDKNEQEAVKESAHLIINCLVGLIGYRHMMNKKQLKRVHILLLIVSLGLLGTVI